MPKYLSIPLLSMQTDHYWMWRS